MIRWVPAVLTRHLTAAAAGATILAAATAAPAQTTGDLDREAVEQIVREYILANPEIIVEAIQILQARDEQASRDAQRTALTELSDTIFNSPTSPWMGEADADVVIVEFFDYECGYCARVLDDVFALSDEDPSLRVVFKELPILTPMSMLAARAALASRSQDLYVPYHNALMGHQGPLSEGAIFDIAAEVGLDVDQLRTDMESEEVIGEIQTNLQLAEAIGVRGTPAFIIGDEVIPGAVGLAILRDLVARERAG